MNIRFKYWAMTFLLMLIGTINGIPEKSFSYAWNMTDLFREKMREDFLVGSIWYHSGEDYKFEGRDHAVTHVFGEYQNDPGSTSLFQGGVIVPVFPNRVLPNTFTQIRLFYLHSKPGSMDQSAEVMSGGKVTFGNWEYYEQDGASAVTGNAWLEFSFGYLASFYYSPFVFGGALSNQGQQQAESQDNDRFYYELNIPFLNLTSYYKKLTDDGKKDIWAVGFNYAGAKGTVDYLEAMVERYPDKEYNFRFFTKGLLGWFNLGAEYQEKDEFYYGMFGIEHLFLIRGDAKEETAYFSKKYSWGIGFYVFGGYYDPAKDPAIDYQFFKKSDFPYTFGTGISVQMPLMIFLDVGLVAGGVVLAAATVVTEIPIAIAYYVLSGELYEFYLTQMVFSMEEALLLDMGRQWDRDVWKDNAVWCQFHIGAHYNDREALIRNPAYALRESRWNDIFYYGKLDIFF